jgi:hypothetical protein
MKVLDYLFFGVFNSYYKDGNFKNDIPWYTAMMIFGAMFFLNVSSVMMLFSSKSGYPVSKQVGFIIGGCCVLLSYFLFAWKKRYENIYSEFSKYDRRQRSINRLMGWLYVALSIFVAIIPPLKQVLEK